MFDLNPSTPSEVITAVAAVLEVIAYFAFYHLAQTTNRGREGKFTIGPRALGCIGTAAVAVWMIRYAQANLIDTAVYAGLSAKEQGEYLGRVLRSIVVPALVIIGLAAARGWRDKQERRARGLSDR